MTLRVLIAEDSALLREGLRRILEDAGIEVAAEAGSYDELLAATDVEIPDLVLTDIRMPPTGSDEGLRAAERIRERRPGTAVLILSQYVEPEYVERLLSGNPVAVGYLLKDRVGNAAELVEAVVRVCDGETVIDPEVIAALMARRRANDPIDLLTDKERDILRLMAQGRSNAGISQEMFLSSKTVERHVANIFTKLELQPGTHDNRRVLAVLRHLRAG